MSQPDLTAAVRGGFRDRLNPSDGRDAFGWCRVLRLTGQDGVGEVLGLPLYAPVSPKCGTTETASPSKWTSAPSELSWEVIRKSAGKFTPDELAIFDSGVTPVEGPPLG
jgi:hypothetical protein